MSNKTILVTGSAGMIGCYLVKDLIAKGCTVVGVDRRVSDWTHEHLKQVVLDLADKNALEALLVRRRWIDAFIWPHWHMLEVVKLTLVLRGSSF